MKFMKCLEKDLSISKSKRLKWNGLMEFFIKSSHGYDIMYNREDVVAKDEIEL